MTKRIEAYGNTFATNATRKITSGATTIKSSAGVLEKIIISDPGQKCVVAIKDGTTTKMLFTLQQNTEMSGQLSYVIPCEFNFSTSLIVEMYKLDPAMFLNFNTPSSTTMEDLSGNDYDGTGTNMEAADKTEDPQRGKHITLGGTDEHILFGDILDWDGSSEARSFSFWIKAALGSVMNIFSKYNTPPGWTLELLADGKMAIFLADTGTGELRVVSVGSISDDAWTHVVLTVDGTGDESGVTFYINGTATTTTNTANTLAATSTNAVQFTIGARNAGGSLFFTGKIDEFMIFLKELSASEAEFIYRNGYGYGASDGARLGDITLIYE